MLSTTSVSTQDKSSATDSKAIAIDTNMFPVTMELTGDLFFIFCEVEKFTTPETIAKAKEERLKLFAKITDSFFEKNSKLDNCPRGGSSGEFWFLFRLDDNQKHISKENFGDHVKAVLKELKNKNLISESMLTSMLTQGRFLHPLFKHEADFTVDFYIKNMKSVLHRNSIRARLLDIQNIDWMASAPPVPPLKLTMELTDNVLFTHHVLKPDANSEESAFAQRKLYEINSILCADLISCGYGLSPDLFIFVRLSKNKSNRYISKEDFVAKMNNRFEQLKVKGLITEEAYLGLLSSSKKFTYPDFKHDSMDQYFASEECAQSFAFGSPAKMVKDNIAIIEELDKKHQPQETTTASSTSTALIAQGSHPIFQPENKPAGDNKLERATQKSLNISPN